MFEIGVNASDLHALSCDSRLSILKSLRDRRKTVSELSNDFGLSKSTIHEHLEKLMQAELIEKNHEYTNKWVYYQLTKKGEAIFSPKENKIMLILGATLLLMIGAIWVAFNSIPKPPSPPLTVQEEIHAGLLQMSSFSGVIFALIVLGILVLAFYFWKKKK